MRLYVAYDRDGLPIAVEETVAALARTLGVKPNSISRRLSLGSDKYAKVEIEDEVET